MERGSSLKNQSIGGRNMRVIITNKVKDIWNNGSECHGDEGDVPGAFSWPPRSYTCSFCKREFRSAQALGGHMNVHRRDRARLRQSPPRNGQYSLLNLNLEPNPSHNFNTNPSFSSSSPSTKSPPFTSRLPQLFAAPLSTPATVTEMRRWGKDGFAQLNQANPITADSAKVKATKRLLDLEKLGSIMHGKEGTIAKKTEIVRLELEIGLLGKANEDLDLELRLGYA